MMKIVSLEHCKTLDECRRVLGRRKPDYILVSRKWLNIFCPNEYWTHYRGIELLVSAMEVK